jgi:hypothetical protein
MGYKKRTVGFSETARLRGLSRTDSRTVRNTGEVAEIVPDDVPEVEVENATATAEIPDAVMKSAEEDAVMKRKLEIAEKRRASLALARTKIIPKSQLKKQVLEATKVVEDVVKSKDEVIRNKQEETDAMRLKYERERVKQLEDSLFTLQKLIAEKPPAPVPVPLPVPTPANELIAEKPKAVAYKRPSRAKSAVAERVVETSKQPQQIIPKKSVEARITRPAAPATETLIDMSYGEQLQERLRTEALKRAMYDTFGGF